MITYRCEYCNYKESFKYEKAYISKCVNCAGDMELIRVSPARAEEVKLVYDKTQEIKEN